MALKTITKKENEFAKAIAEGLSAVDAFRQVYKRKCEPATPDYNKAHDLTKTVRVRRAVEEWRDKLDKQAEMHQLVGKSTPNWDSVYKFAFDRLVYIRDDPNTPAKTRYDAMEVLEKIQDPTQDVNLIWRYVDMIWNGMQAHCPCCHADFPLWKVKNEALDKWRKENDVKVEKHQDTLKRRLYLFGKGEKRKDPRDHPGQLAILATPNRHAICKGAARVGKSYSLAMLGFLHLLIPGVEIWLLSRVYDEAEPEFKYLEDFLRTAFYPIDRYVYTKVYDRKTGEAYIETKWGSKIQVKSGKAKGSITGHELEAILVAEPGWVDGELFEEVRARMSSRLGRIFAFGTPKGFGGFLGRLMRMTTRDMRSGKRLAPGARLVENGCEWAKSIFQYEMKPEENPAYVTSEVDAAKSELTAVEFASEFEGRMIGDSNLKFPYVTDKLLVPIPRDQFNKSVFVLGVDQGERNFGACLIGWDGQTVRVCYEMFDGSEKTIKANLIELNQTVPAIIRIIGGIADAWHLTIFDSDPLIDNQLLELETENRPWKTQHTLKPKNVIETQNWREETCLWVNEMAKEGRILFLAEQCDLIHEQIKEALIREGPEDTDAPSKTRKRWVIYDPWRGDHVCFDPATEVLTKDGWMNIKDIKKGQIVLTRNFEGGIEYKPVLYTIEKDFDGQMIDATAGRSGGVEFSVTPDHSLYVEDVFASFTGTKEQTFFIKAGAFVEGQLKQQYSIPARSKPSVPGRGLTLERFDPLAFSYFLGFYIAEGCRSISGSGGTKYVHLDQKYPDVLEKICTSLNFGNKPYKAGSVYRVSIADAFLFDLLGKKATALDKRIPRWFFDTANLNEHIQLFNGLMDGDGTWGQNKYDSVSIGLIDDVQELVSRLGVVSSLSKSSGVRVIKAPNKKYNKVYNGNPVFRVRYRSLEKDRTRLSLKRKNLKRRAYKGKVYCISVPPYNNIFIRYKGKTTWIGQCDAWLMALWTIYCQALHPKETTKHTYDGFEEQRRAQEFQRISRERRELGMQSNENEIFKSIFGRSQGEEASWLSGTPGYYSDES